MLWESLTLLSSFWKLKDCTNIFTVDALKHWRLNLWKLFFDGDECPYDVPAILCELNICMQLFSVLVCTTCLWNDEDDMETQSIKCLRKTHSLIPPPHHTHTHSLPPHTHTHYTYMMVIVRQQPNLALSLGDLMCRTKTSLLLLSTRRETKSSHSPFLHVILEWTLEVH